jgi:hypothetical protein
VVRSGSQRNAIFMLDLIRIFLYLDCPALVFGESGCGKSSLLANWFLQEQTKLEQKRPEFYSQSEEDRRKEIQTNLPPLLFAHFVSSAPEAADPINIMRRIMAAIRTHFSLAMSIPDRDEDITREFPYWLQSAADRGRVVILIDAVDLLAGDRATIARAASNAFIGEGDSSASKEEARLAHSTELSNRNVGSDDTAKALNWLPLSFPSAVRVVLSCSSMPVLSHLSQGRGWNKALVKLPDLLPAQKSQLVQGYLQLFGKKLTPSDQNTLTSAPLSGSPLFLRAVMDELRSGAVFENLSRQLASYTASKSIAELFDRILGRWEADYNGSDPSNPLVEQTLSCALTYHLLHVFHILICLPSQLFWPQERVSPKTS